MDRLVEPRPRLDEPVLDGVERACDADLEAGLLGDLAQGCLLARLACGRSALGECPRPGVAIAASTSHHEPRAFGVESDDDAARGSGGRRPQAGHGADAAPDRRAVPARPERDHAMTTSGRGRPPADRRMAAGLMARQPARSCVTGATAGPCRTVARTPGALNVPDGRSPSRRSRKRVEGRTNRAAGRAAYLAAMLWSMGRLWYRFRQGLQAPHQGPAASSRRPPATVARRVLRPGRSHVARQRRTARERPARDVGSVSRCERSVPRSPRVIGPVSAARIPRARALPSVPSMSGP